MTPGTEMIVQNDHFLYSVVEGIVSLDSANESVVGAALLIATHPKMSRIEVP